MTAQRKERNFKKVSSKRKAQDFTDIKDFIFLQGIDIGKQQAYSEVLKRWKPLLTVLIFDGIAKKGSPEIEFDEWLEQKLKEMKV